MVESVRLIQVCTVKWISFFKRLHASRAKMCAHDEKIERILTILPSKSWNFSLEHAITCTTHGIHERMMEAFCAWRRVIICCIKNEFRNFRFSLWMWRELLPEHSIKKSSCCLSLHYTLLRINPLTKNSILLLLKQNALSKFWTRIVRKTLLGICRRHK